MRAQVVTLILMSFSLCACGSVQDTGFGGAAPASAKIALAARTNDRDVSAPVYAASGSYIDEVGPLVYANPAQRVVCRHEKPIGSHIVRRVCRTVAQIDQQRIYAQALFRHWTIGSSPPP